jgi:4-amino-4-deoxy-L-arabinose transferase-like glycosyltransferase
MEKTSLITQKKFAFQQYWIIGVILLLTILAYIPVFNAGFVNLDDNGYVYENKDVLSGGIGSVSHFFTRFYVGHYQPLTMISLKIDYWLFGLNTQAFHIVNLIFHLFNCCLVFILLQKIFGNKATSLLVMALFALHPMHVESVAWISERKDVLYVFFLLISAILYTGYIFQGSKRKLLYLSFFAFVLALFSKSAAIIFPFLLILIDLVLKRTGTARIIIEKLPFLLLSVLFAVITMYSQDVGGKGSEVYSLFSGFEKLLFAFYSVGFYILKLFTPFGLSAFHPFPDIAAGNLPAEFKISLLISFIFLVILVWAIIRSIRMRRLGISLFGMLFYLVCISLYLFLPVGRVVVAERFSYLSYIGLFIVFAALINKVLITVKNQNLRHTIISLVVVLILFFSVLTHFRSGVWQNGIALWENVLKSYPADPFSNKSLADAFVSYRNYNRALDFYIRALTYDPDYTQAYYNMGHMNLKNNKLFQAIHDFTKAIEIDPTMADAYINRGNAKAQLKDLQGAIDDYTLAIKNDPEKTEAYVNRGSSWYMLKNIEKACSDWKIAGKLGNAQANEMLLSFCK